MVAIALGNHPLVRRNSESAGKRRVPELDAVAGELKLRPWRMSSADVDLVREAADNKLIALITTVPSVYTAEVLAAHAGCEGIAGTAVANCGKALGITERRNPYRCVPGMVFPGMLWFLLTSLRGNNLEENIFRVCARIARDRLRFTMRAKLRSATR
ncbi:hypothetical protein [Nocardia sp. NPDC047654]|uniref:hypothetical protein n=1 Tax=Nocardia sp. NPDC047654 TaxID=3364314 RepID=UPI003720D93A